MSLSFDVLANLKTDISEDEERIDGGFLETFETSALSDEEGFAEAAVEDPLQENTKLSTKKEFVGEFNDEDFMNCSDREEEPDEKTQARSRNKRAKLTTTLKGRNGHVWSTVKPTEQEALFIDASSQHFQPKGKGPALKVSNPLEAWHLLVDEPILLQIVKHTNEEIRKRRSKASFERATDLIELRAWLGLNYLCGLFHNSPNSGPLEELWTLELGNSIFRATMPVKRFEFITDCIRFADADTNAANLLEPVSRVWEKFMINVRSYYSPSGNCTIDDHILSSTDAKCPYQFSLPEHHSLHGLRLVSLCDAKTLYMCKAFIATTATPTDKDIMHLVCDIKGTSRNIAVSDRYTSLQLGNKLLKNQLTLIGALPTTAPDLPKDLLTSTEQRKLYDGATTIISGLNSTESPTGLLLTSGISDKINARKLYASTESSCQRFQQLAATFSTSFTTTSSAHYRWPLQFFHELLNCAAVNAWILLRLSEKGEADLQQRDFQRKLGLYLTQQQLKRRLQQQNSKLSITQKLNICEILGETTDKYLCEAMQLASKSNGAGVIPLEKAKVSEGIALVSKINEKRLRCRKCPTNGNKTRLRCQECLRPLCNRHLIARCQDCCGVMEVPEEHVGMDRFFQ